MVRVKRGKTALRKRKRLLQQVKGFRWGRKNRLRAAKDALRHALVYAYRDRKRRKREIRKFWESQINSASRQAGISYSRFIYGLKKNKIELDRKILAELIQKHPDIFKKIVEKTK